MNVRNLSVSLVLLLLALGATAFAWFMAAGWFGIDPGNFNAWLAAGAAFFIASFVVG